MAAIRPVGLPVPPRTRFTLVHVLPFVRSRLVRLVHRQGGRLIRSSEIRSWDILWDGSDAHVHLEGLARFDGTRKCDQPFEIHILIIELQLDQVRLVERESGSDRRKQLFGCGGYLARVTIEGHLERKWSSHLGTR